MPKSRPKSQTKARKRSRAKEKPMEGRKSFSHFVLEFFLSLFSPLWKLGRKLFNSGSSDKNREPSLSLERLDAASSPSARATPSQMSVAGAINDNDSCDVSNSTGHSNEALPVSPENIEAVISSTRVMDGGIVRVDRVGYQKKEEAEFTSFERVREIEDDEIKSDSGDWKKRYYDEKRINGGLKKERDDLKKERDDLKKERDDLKKDREVFDNMVKLRQVFSNFRMTQSIKIMDDGIKEEVLKLKGAMRERINTIIAKVPFTRILLLMLFQRANMALEWSFCCSHWRSHNRFPKFINDSDDYKWWEENFVHKILEKRLGILQVAAKNWNPKLEIFRIIKLVSDLNSRLHRQPRENEFNEEDEVKMFEYEGIDLQPTLRHLCSGDENLELEESSVECDAGGCEFCRVRMRLRLRKTGFACL